MNIIPAKIKVAHFVNDETSTISLRISGPKNDEIYKSKLSSRSVYVFQANQTGVYKFSLDNSMVWYLILLVSYYFL
ncbi:MAG: emp24/gp25L/p24 family protein [Flavobacteriales bacterium]|nr:emp24/gp25L/p24 family protein [Flavobacteriales bacterium]